MKSEKTRQIIRAAAFFLALLVPLILFLPQTGYVDLSIINIEKRNPVPLPSLGDTAYTRLPTAYEEYIQDRIPYRRQIIELNAALNYRVFGTIEGTRVLLGREGWLFSKNQPPQNNQFDYQGIGHFTAEETAALRTGFAALAARCAAEGRQLVLVIGPNKEGVYARYMPESVPVLNEESRADALVAALQGIENLTVVWPKAELQAASETRQVYYKYDTHWNDLGAYIATRQLLRAVGIEAPPLADLPVTKAEAAPPVDLANMAGTYPFATDDAAWQVGYNTHVHAPGEIGNEAFTSEAADTRNILVLRDSFAAMMMPYINRSFASGSYLDVSAATGADITAAGPDIVVIETVERNLFLLPAVLQNLLQ